MKPKKAHKIVFGDGQMASYLPGREKTEILKRSQPSSVAANRKCIMGKLKAISARIPRLSNVY